MAGPDVAIKKAGGDFGMTDATETVNKDWFNQLTKLSASDNQGFLSDFSQMFDDNVKIKKGTLDKALQAVTADASDPAALAKYQAALAEYTLYRNAQSNAVKAYKDVDANTIRNFN